MKKSKFLQIFVNILNVAIFNNALFLVVCLFFKALLSSPLDL